MQPPPNFLAPQPAARALRSLLIVSSVQLNSSRLPACHGPSNSASYSELRKALLVQLVSGLRCAVGCRPGLSAALLSAALERVEQYSSSSCYIMDRSVECVLIGARGGIEPADLAHELKCCIVQLLFARKLFGISQSLDVPAHGKALSYVGDSARSNMASAHEDLTS